LNGKSPIDNKKIGHCHSAIELDKGARNLYEGKWVSAIIAAAGQGKRMNLPINKQYLLLGGKPVLAHTLETFQRCLFIDEMIVVVQAEERSYCMENIVQHYGFDKVAAVIPGGAERQESVYKGLKAVDERCDIIIVHDGARPFVKIQDIESSIRQAIAHGAVGIGVPVKDTIKIVDEQKIIIDTPQRSKLWAIQTPQTFSYSLLLEAHEKAREEGFTGTDDTVLVERIGHPVRICMGSDENIKITTPADVHIAESIMKKRKGADMRVGLGYDVHRLVEGRALIIGGVHIPYEKGLLGHSDADVLLHAIKDAMLGAAGLGDIGKHFPDRDERYKGISSIKLLIEVKNMLRQKGYSVNNIDATIIAQAPRMAPYIDEMKKNIAHALSISIDRLNIKATTTEGLGFAGMGQGIAAQAVVSILQSE